MGQSRKPPGILLAFGHALNGSKRGPCSVRFLFGFPLSRSQLLLLASGSAANDTVPAAAAAGGRRGRRQDGASVSASASVSACASSSMPLGCFLLRREIHASASDHKARLSRKRPLPAHERAAKIRKFLKLVSL